MSLDHDDTKTNSAVSDLYSDEEETKIITWDRNLASIPGTLTLCDRALRTQHAEVYRYVTTRTVEDRGITYIDRQSR